jgi:hypothetical protein
MLSTPTGGNPWASPSCGRPLNFERPENVVKVGSNGHLVVEKILEPEIIAPLSHCDERQQVAEADANARLRELGLVDIGRGGKNAKMRGHGRTSMRP